MLQIIRGKVGSWFIKILFVLIAIALGGVGLTDIFGGTGVGATVATVGSERITVQRLTNAFQIQLQQLQRQYGPSFSVELAINLGMMDQTIEGLVNEALFDQAADTLGLRTPDSVIADAIREDPLFQDRTGQFSQVQFNNYLAATRVDEPSFVAQRRRELARQELISVIGASAAVPDTLAEALHRYRNETRHITAILIGSATVGDVGAPTEEEIGAYYRENEQQFMAPEYRELRVISLTAEAVAETVEFSEEQLLAEYELRRDQFDTPEQRAFDQIVVSDEEVAARIAEAAAGGLTLAEAVDTVEDAQVSVIPLELAPRSEFLPALADAGFALAEDGVSAPVNSPFGWHVLQVTEILTGGVPEFETVREEIETELKLDEARELVFALSDDLDDLIASDVSLDDAAAQLGLPLHVTGPVARDGSLRDGGRLDGIPALPMVLDVGFTQFELATSPPEETPDEDFFVVRTEQVIAPALRPIDEVRDEIVAAWVERQTAAAAEALAETIAERLDSGDSVADVAAEFGAVMVEQSDLRRDGANRGTLPEALVASVFDISTGDVAIAPAADGHVVAKLEAVIAAPASDSGTLEDIAAGQSRAIAGDLLAGFAASLRSEYDIDIDRTSISRLYQQPQNDGL